MSAIVGKNYELPALDLNFAENKSLIDSVTGRNLITFSRSQSGKEATYVGSDGLIKYAGADEARFDYNPTTGESLGLLIEESRTNYFLNSDSNNPSKWNAYPGVTITTSTTTAPDGSSNAIRIQATTSGQYAERTWVAPTTNTYSGSIYIRSRTGTDQSVRIDFSGAGTTVQTVPSSGDWVRLRDTHGSTANAGGRYFYIQSLIGETLDVDVWGEQIELGSFPTSYIPTSGSTVTRNADEASITGTNFSGWYNQSEGTVFANCSFLGFTTLPIVWSLKDNLNNSNDLIAVFAKTSGQIRYVSNDTSVTQWSKDMVGSVALNTPVKTASAYKINDIAFSVDGASILTDAAATITTAIDRLHLGYVYTGTQQLTGHISRLTYWPKRLSDIELQQLTK
jgi:hypothetical protein